MTCKFCKKQEVVADKSQQSLHLGCMLLMWPQQQRVGTHLAWPGFPKVDLASASQAAQSVTPNMPVFLPSFQKETFPVDNSSTHHSEVGPPGIFQWLIFYICSNYVIITHIPPSLQHLKKPFLFFFFFFFGLLSSQLISCSVLFFDRVLGK